MAQSIASPQGNVASGKQPSDDLQPKLSWLWSVVVAMGSAFAATVWQLRYAFRTGNIEALDIDKISARLSVKSRAETDGRNNQPNSTEEGISGTQREIVVYFRELQRRSQKKLTNLSDKLRQLAMDIDVLAVGSDLRDIPPRCENRVLRLIAESQSQLNLLTEQAVQQQQIHAASIEKTQQNLRSDRPISPIVQWVFLVALIGVGALVIAKASISGFGEDNFMPPSWAIANSLIVVLVSFVIARVFSGPSHHAENFRQSTHRLGKGFGVALIMLMAVVAAYYIGAVTTDPTISVRSVVDSVLADPNAIRTELIDWKIFGIVAAIGSMAFIVSYRQNGSQPGQSSGPGVIYRARKKRDQLSKRLRMQINAIIDQADAEVTALPKRLKTQISQYSKLVEEADRMPAIMGDYDVALEDGCGILLDRYRSININARESETPGSFAEHVCFRSEIDPNFSAIAKEKSRLEQFQNGLVEIEKDTVEVREKLRGLNARAIGTLEDFAVPPA
jgi:hypothetical protein